MKCKRIACFCIALLIVVCGLLSILSETALAVSDPIGTAICTARRYINLRSGPGTKYKRTGRLPAKATVNIYQQSGKWYKIFYNNTYQWAYGSYLRVSLNTGGTSSSPTPVIDGNAIGTAICTARRYINLRSGPSTRYKRTGKLPSKASVTVYQKSGSWYKILYRGSYQWASASYLRVTMNSTPAVTTPVPTPVQDPYASFPYAAIQRLSGKIVFIDPGHGQGAGGVYKDYQEYIYNLKFANLLKQNLENSGATVIMTRTSSDDVYNYSRMAMLNRYGLTLVQGVRQTEYNANLQKIADLEKKIADLQPTESPQPSISPTPTPSLSQEQPEDPALTEAKAQLAELQKQNETLNATIEDIKSLEGVMQSVEQNTVLAQTYFLCPYDQVCGRAVHDDLKRIFEYLKDPVVQNNMIFVSLHTNATGSGSTSVNGTVTYYMDNAVNTAYYTGYPTEKNKKLAEVLLDNTAASAGFTKRGCVVNDFFMVRETTIPAALIEIGFHTNTEDREKLVSDTYEKRIANGILFGIFDYFGL